MYISIGDVSCQKLDADDLSVVDNVLIVNVQDDRTHKPQCERAFTLLHQHNNCVLNMSIQQKKNEQVPMDLSPISLSNLENNRLEEFGLE